MENKTNNVTFDVTGHTKIWHKEAGKVYDDPRGELVLDKKNTIDDAWRDFLMERATSNLYNYYLSSSGFVTLAADSAELNINLAGATGTTSNIDGKDCMIIGSAATISATSSVIHAMKTEKLDDVGRSKSWRGIFTKTSAGSQQYQSAAFGINIVQKPGIATALNAMFQIFIASQITPAFNRTLNQNDTLTIDWTITIN
jgi:hypothetical protein